MTCGRLASSPSAARSSTTRLARFASETWTSGQRRERMAAFETAFGTALDQQIEQRESLGRYRQRLSAPNTSRVSESKTNPRI